jgi:hypothetical protein
MNALRSTLIYPYLLSLTSLIFICLGCKQLDEAIELSGNELLSFGIVTPHPTDPKLPGDTIMASIDEDVVLLQVPFRATITNVTPVFTTSPHARLMRTVEQKLSIINKGFSTIDITKPLPVYVVAENGSKRPYVINADKLPNTENHFTSFKFRGIENPGTISKNTINVKVYKTTTRLDSLIPVFEVAEHAIVSHSDNVVLSDKMAFDFTQTQTFIVTSQSGEPREYSVLVENDKNFQFGNDILTFKLIFPDNVERRALVNIQDRTVSLKIPYHADLTQAKAVFTLSPAATLKINGVKQSSGIPQPDFNLVTELIVFAEDGQSRKFLLKIERESPPKADK